jgi:IS30 family transposase
MAGRPAKTLTERQREEVETLAPFLSTDQIADYFGIGRTTFYAMMERDSDISERYKRGRAKVVADISNSLIMKAREHWFTSDDSQQTS